MPSSVFLVRITSTKRQGQFPHFALASRKEIEINENLKDQIQFHFCAKLSGPAVQGLHFRHPHHQRKLPFRECQENAFRLGTLRPERYRSQETDPNIASKRVRSDKTHKQMMKNHFFKQSLRLKSIATPLSPGFRGLQSEPIYLWNISLNVSLNISLNNSHIHHMIAGPHRSRAAREPGRCRERFYSPKMGTSSILARSAYSSVSSTTLADPTEILIPLVELWLPLLAQAASPRCTLIVGRQAAGPPFARQALAQAEMIGNDK